MGDFWNSNLQFQPPPQPKRASYGPANTQTYTVLHKNVWQRQSNLTAGCRAGARTLTKGGVYSFIQVLPDWNQLNISKETSRAEPEYMNITPTPINALAPVKERLGAITATDKLSVLQTWTLEVMNALKFPGLKRVYPWIRSMFFSCFLSRTILVDWCLIALQDLFENMNSLNLTCR